MLDVTIAPPAEDGVVTMTAVLVLLDMEDGVVTGPDGFDEDFDVLLDEEAEVAEDFDVLLALAAGAIEEVLLADDDVNDDDGEFFATDRQARS